MTTTIVLAALGWLLVPVAFVIARAGVVLHAIHRRRDDAEIAEFEDWAQRMREASDDDTWPDWTDEDLRWIDRLTGESY